MASVTVNITATTVTPSRESFGTPGLLAYLGASPPWTDLSRIYSSMSGAIADGIVNSGDTAACYQALSKGFAQNPRPQYIRVLRKTTAPTRSYTLTVNASATNGVMKATVGGQSVTVVQSSATTSTSATQLKTALDAVAVVGGFTTSAVAGSTITITPTANTSRCVAFSGLTSNLTFAETTADPSTSSDLDAVFALANDWYTLSLVGEGKAEIAAAASWCATNKRLLVTDSMDSACYDSASTTDAMYVAKAATQECAIVFSSSNQDYKGFAACCTVLAKDAGTVTWKFKRLLNCTVDSLTDTQIANIRAKNGNVYTTELGVAGFREGVMANGTFIDQKHGLDWLGSEIKVDVYGPLAGADKVPYTQEGMDVLEGGLRRALTEAVRRKFLNPGFTITVPNVSALDPTVRATRVVNALEWQGILQGAVHEVIVNGAVSS